MIFASPEEVNLIWSVIAKAIANNELGTAAKVAPDDGQTRKDRLICIYTHNFTDVADVTRVARKLKDLGLLDGRGRGIYYKLGMCCIPTSHLLIHCELDTDVVMKMHIQS
jgi:hypothetical protein